MIGRWCLVSFHLDRATVKAAVLNRLGNVLPANALAGLKVRHGARHLEDAVVRPSREIQSDDRLLQQSAALGLGLAEAIDLPGRGLAVALALARELPPMAELHMRPDRRRRLTRLDRSQILLG
jgi:hypothetical protein